MSGPSCAAWGLLIIGWEQSLLTQDDMRMLYFWNLTLPYH